MGSTTLSQVASRTNVKTTPQGTIAKTTTSSMVYLGGYTQPSTYGSFTLNQKKMHKLATQRAAASIIEAEKSP
jgi:hypothetical protein